MEKPFDKFLIGSWITYFNYSVMSQEEQMKRLAELGVNYQPFPFSWYEPNTHDSLDDWKEIDRLCRKYGVVYGMATAANKLGITEEALKNNVKFAAEMSDNLIVYHIMDEPTGSQISMLAEWIRRYKEADGRVIPTFNLLPSYASARTLNNSFEGYLQAVVDAVGAENICFLSHDYYPFRADGFTKLNMFADMEDSRKVAYRNGKLRTHAFLQSGKWRGMRMPDIDEMRWQAYCYLAYGFKALSYFNIVMPNSDNPEGHVDGLIRQNGEVCDPELLDNVGKLNWELRAVGDEMISMQTVHAYHTHGVCEHIELLPKNYRIRPLDEEHPFIVTEHENPDMFMIVNNSFEWKGYAEFFVEGAKEIHVFNPELKKYSKCDYRYNKLKIGFAKGEGLLFKIV